MYAEKLYKNDEIIGDLLYILRGGVKIEQLTKKKTIEVKGREISTSKKLVYMAMFVAITCVLSRFVSIQLPLIKIAFSFIPIALSAMLFGPVFGGIVAGAEDLIGATLFPKGAFCLGFTLSAILVGVIYGLVLYKKPKTTGRFIVANSIIAVTINIVLNTTWLIVFFGKGFAAISVIRIVKALIMIPIEVFMLKITWKYIGERLEKTI